jgi:hypothetical protein
VRSDGPALVARHIGAVLEYHAAQCSAGNYGAREAACVGIAELALRIDGVAVRPHAQRMLAALLPALSDSAWPVRDAVRCVRACVCLCLCVCACA